MAVRTWVTSGIGLALLGAVAGTLWYVNTRDGLDSGELRKVTAEAAETVAAREIRRHSYRAVLDEVRRAVEDTARRHDLPVPRVDMADAEQRRDGTGGYLMTYHFQLADERSGSRSCLLLRETVGDAEGRGDGEGAVFEPRVVEGECPAP